MFIDIFEKKYISMILFCIIFLKLIVERKNLM